MKIKEFFKTEQFKELLLSFVASILSLIAKTNFTNKKEIEINNNHVNL